MITVRELIRQLGGPTRVAARCGVSVSAVTNWSARDRIASDHVVAIWRQAHESGVEWAPPGAEDLSLAAREAA